jgi:hypothetical protein
MINPSYWTLLTNHAKMLNMLNTLNITLLVVKFTTNLITFYIHPDIIHMGLSPIMGFFVICMNTIFNTIICNILLYIVPPIYKFPVYVCIMGFFVFKFLKSNIEVFVKSKPQMIVCLALPI